MRLMILLLVALGTAPVPAQDGALELADPKEDIIVVCPITGVIDPGVSVVVKRAVKEAEHLNAKLIVFRIDTPGGRVDSAVEIASAIGGAPCRTMAYIENMGAISAGALISFSCDDIIMTPGSNIGAATPVIPTAGGMQPTGEKEVSFMRAKMRALAESNGHNPDIAQAMVDKDIELRVHYDADGAAVVYALTTTSDAVSAEKPERVKAPSPLEDVLRTLSGDVPKPLEQPAEETPSAASESPGPKPGTVVYEDGSELVLASGKLLTLTPKEAEKYGLIPTTVETLDEAVSYYQMGGGRYEIVEANWAEKTFKFLTSPTIAGLLLMLGIGGLYFEVKTPGFGIPGIIGVTCLTLLFGSHYVLGLTDVIDIVLIAAGLILLVVELFILPGFGIAGIAGFLCLFVGTYLALVDVAIPQYSWDFERLNDVIYSFTVALVTFFVFVFLIWRYLPRTPIYGWLVLSRTQQVADGYVTQTREDVQSALGLKGTTTSMLRPAGWARFGDRKLQVVSQGAFIPKGIDVEVVEVEGNRYVVERIKEHG